jgi:tetratricopeptide (TPR) repeat protein
MSGAMSPHFGVRPTLAALLSGLVLSVSLPDSSCAGQDLQYLSFHPVPLTTTAASDSTGQHDSTHVEYTLRPTRLDPAAREAKYREAIATVRSTEGPYALPLSEHLLGLGRLLQRQGQLDAALDAYETSMHVLRVNLGLYSLEQKPVLRAIFSAYAARGDIDNAHATQEALFNLQLRHHGGDSPAAVSALLDWADWNVNLYLLLDPLPTVETGVRPYPGLNDPRLELAYNTYTRALETLQAHAAIGDERLVTTERKLAALNFITNQKLHDTYGDTLAYYAATRPSDFNSPGDVLEDATSAHFYDGSSALQRALAHSYSRPERRNDDIATRMVELGDWYLLFDRRAAALDQYRDALQFMREASLPPEEVERIMSSGMPVPTPDTAYLPPPDDREFDGFIDVEFALSKFGMATHPHIIGSSTNNKQIERELLREIRDCKFRPKFVADAPVNNEKIRLRYYYSL